MNTPDKRQFVPVKTAEEVVDEIWDRMVKAPPTPPAPESGHPLTDETIKSLMYKHLSPRAVDALTYTSRKNGKDIECVGSDIKALIKDAIALAAAALPDIEQVYQAHLDGNTWSDISAERFKQYATGEIKVQTDIRMLYTHPANATD